MLYFFETKKTKVSMRRTWLHKLRRERLSWRGVLSKRSGACVLRRGCCECCRFRLSRRCHARWRGTLRNARRRHHTAKKVTQNRRSLEELLKSHTQITHTHTKKCRRCNHSLTSERNTKRNTKSQGTQVQRMTDESLVLIRTRFYKSRFTSQG